MKKNYLIGNLKMNLSSREEAEQYLSVLRREMAGRHFDHTEIVVAPPYIHLDRFQRELAKGVALAAQNVFWEKEGSYTGEISPIMLKNIGAEYVIVGHSERRTYGQETDDEIEKKVRSLLHSNLRPILCVGEAADERAAGRIADVLEAQLSGPFRELSPLQAEKLIIAYEPRWAIGTDRTPASEEVLQAKVIIYRTISSLLGAATAERIPILYGGSVKAALLEKVCFDSQMDGVLVGRESLFPYELVKMAERMETHDREALGSSEDKSGKNHK